MFRPFLLSRLPHVALLTALLLFTWILANWTWVFLLPPQKVVETQAGAPLLSKVLAEKVIASNMFGGASSGVETTGAAAVSTQSNIGLRGVYASRDGRSGFAVLLVDGNPLSAVTGQEFLPGLVLQRVYPDRVEILRGGQLETAQMPAAAVASTNTTSQTNSLGTNGALQMVVQQLGANQFGFSRAALLATLKRADQMALLGRYGLHPRGGAVLERSPAGGLPEKLGLKVGDVLTSINGKSLSGPGDVARLYELLTKNERVSVDVLRAGEKLKYGLQVAP